MKRSLIAGLVLGAIAIPALCAAQGVANNYKGEVPVVVGIHNWAGFYLGGNVGGKWASIDSPVTSAALPLLGVPAGTVGFHSRPSSFAGGVQLGYNWQFCQTVLGLEGDFDWTNLRASRTVSVDGIGDFVAGDSFRVHNKWESSLRVRAGYVWDSWLLYVTGGAAFANVRASANFIPVVTGGIPFPGSSGADERTLYGGTIGAGAEYAWDDNWSLGAEYRYSAYRSKTENLGQVAAVFLAPGVYATVPVTSRVHMHTNEALFKINYKFS